MFTYERSTAFVTQNGIWTNRGTFPALTTNVEGRKVYSRQNRLHLCYTSDQIKVKLYNGNRLAKWKNAAFQNAGYFEEIILYFKIFFFINAGSITRPYAVSRFICHAKKVFRNKLIFTIVYFVIFHYITVYKK